MANNIEQADPSIGGGSSGSVGSGGSSVSIDTTSLYYYKNTSPNFNLDDDTQVSTDITRLESLMKGWGFSHIDATKVTEWKIATQYDDRGRLEWKGDLYVKDSGLQCLKTKNSNSDVILCSDYQSTGFILLNTHAKKYSNADWRYIYVYELGFAREKNDAFLWSGEKLFKDKEYYIPTLFVDKTSIGQTDTSSVIRDSNNVTLNNALIYSVGAMQSMPLYYIDDKQSYKVWTFDQNVNENSDNSSHDGQYIYNSPIQYHANTKSDVKYWGSTPPVYPELIYNSMEMSDLITSTELEFLTSGVNTPTGVRVVDNRGNQPYYFLGPSDIVVCYTRNTHTGDNKYLFSDEIKYGKNDKKTTHMYWRYFQTKPAAGIRKDQDWKADVPAGWQIFVDAKDGQPEMGLYYSPKYNTSQEYIDAVFSSSHTTSVVLNNYYDPTYFKQHNPEIFDKIWKTKDITFTFDIYTSSDFGLYQAERLSGGFTKYHSYIGVGQGGISGYYYDPKESKTISSWRYSNSSGRRYVKLRFHGPWWYLGVNTPRTEVKIDNGDATALRLKPNERDTYDDVGFHLEGDCQLPNGTLVMQCEAYLGGIDNHRTMRFSFSPNIVENVGRAYVIWRNAAWLPDAKTYLVLGYLSWLYASDYRIDRYEMNSDGSYPSTPTESIPLKDGENNRQFKSKPYDKLVIEKEKPTTANVLFNDGTKEYILGAEPVSLIYLP